MQVKYRHIQVWDDCSNKLILPGLFEVRGKWLIVVAKKHAFRQLLGTCPNELGLIQWTALLYTVTKGRIALRNVSFVKRADFSGNYCS